MLAAGSAASPCSSARTRCRSERRGSLVVSARPWRPDSQFDGIDYRVTLSDKFSASRLSYAEHRSARLTPRPRGVAIVLGSLLTLSETRKLAAQPGEQLLPDVP